ncbi:MAG: energy transducer TonB, partial [Porticoccus sp.]|nr:energy transducer TonB [Porticoccus sp.]
MMSLFRLPVLSSLALTLLLVVSSGAQAAESAATLDELLKMIKSATVSESKEHRARETEFKHAKAQQTQKLKEIQEVRANEERHSEQLEKAYAENELKLVALQEQLEKRLGSLGEMFGHLTSAAGDTRGTLDHSIVSA